MDEKQRVYASRMAVNPSPKLIQACQMFKDREAESETEAYRTAYKQLCDAVRTSLGISNVVGLTLLEDETQVGAYLYDIEAEADGCYIQHCDPETSKMYIEV